MHGPAKVVITVLANLVGLLAADYFLSQVSFGGTLVQLLLVAIAFSILNWLLKPLLRLLFGPVIVLTLGLALVVVNVVILAIVDILFQNLSIHGIAAFVYASLIISFTNLFVHGFTRKPSH